MEGKTCIVTGANSGLGEEVARGLVQEGAYVVLACRNMEACELTRGELGPSNCRCSFVDLENFDSIREFHAREEKQFTKESRTLDVLVNNAGVMGVSCGPDGSDRHLRINHLGPYLLTRLMLPLMGEGARVVNVASRAHYVGSLRIQDGKITDTWGQQSWLFQYARSKLCNVLFTQGLRNRLAGRHVLSYAVSPGMVRTNIFNSLPGWAGWLHPLVTRWCQTPQQGARTILYAAMAPDLPSLAPPGGPLLLHDMKPLEASTSAKSQELAAQLWAISAEMVGLEG